MEEQRISDIDAYLMIVVAIMVDIAQLVLQIIPFAASVLDFIAATIFGIWFAHYDIYLMKKRPLGFLGTFLLEFVPIIDALPLWTFFVIMTLRKARSQEDA